MQDVGDSQNRSVDPVESAYRRGRQAGLAIAALAMSVVAFVSLLGLEKAVLAGTLGVLSLRGMSAGSPGRRWGMAAVVLATVYAATFVTVLIAYHDKLGQLIRLLQQLG